MSSLRIKSLHCRYVLFNRGVRKFWQTMIEKWLLLYLILAVHPAIPIREFYFGHAHLTLQSARAIMWPIAKVMTIQMAWPAQLGY